MARAELLPLKTYTVADGLANNVINKIVRDPRGFLWFCTNEGLSRFDGYGFRNFGTQQGLPSAAVNDLLVTHEGEYWVASNGGLVRFNPKAAPSSEAINVDSDSTKQPHMFSVIVPAGDDRRAKVVNVLVEGRDGTIWCGTYNGLYRLVRSANKLSLEPVELKLPNTGPPPGAIGALLEDQLGALWIGTSAGLYRRAPDGSATLYTKGDGLPDDFVHSLFQDHAGRLWVGTRYAGLFSLSANSAPTKPTIGFHLDSNNGLPTRWIFQVFEDADRRFWAATAQGLCEFFPDAGPGDQRIRLFAEKNGLSYHDITALGADIAGNLWLGTDAAGAMKLARNGFVTYEAQDGILAINSIFNDTENGVCFRGYVVGDKRASFFAGGKVDLMSLGQRVDWPSLGRYDGRDLTWFAPDAFRKDSFGWVGEGVTLQTRNQEWWIAGFAGLYHFPAAANLTQIKSARPIEVFDERNGLASERVLRIFEDSRDRIWVSSIKDGANGLAVWEPQTKTMRSFAGEPQLPSLQLERANSFGEDRNGNVWIGFDSGLARYSNGSFNFFAAGGDLPLNGVRSIYLDPTGRLWLASSRRGLIRVDDSDAGTPGFTAYGTGQGLSSDNAQVITADLNGRIYVGTGRGLDRLDPATGAIEHFTTADGLVAGEFLDAFRDRDGALWFGTQKGMSRFTPSEDRKGAPRPVLIAGLQIDGAAQAVSALGETTMVLTDLSASQNHLQIDFLALGFTPGEVLKYSYMLEGADSDWSAPTEQRTVNYARMAPGHYRFLVRGGRSDDLTSSTPAVITFTILRPIWQRWWFVLLIILILASIIYSIFRYRLARILELANIRTSIAADLHDDIGSNLTRIAILSEVAHSRLGGASEAVDSPLSSIAEISRESVASMGDIVWAINPKRDTLLDLVQRMRRYATELLTPRGIEFQLSAPESQEAVALGSTIRRDLYLIFKESLHNIVRHSGSRNVVIELQMERTAIVLRVRDDGKGFDPDTTDEGQGLLSMQRRAKHLGGDLKIESSPGAGSEILLRFPRRGR